MKIQKQLIENKLNEWKGSHEQLDDILILGFKITEKLFEEI